jgi:hypothetical protein
MGGFGMEIPVYLDAIVAVENAAGASACQLLASPSANGLLKYGSISHIFMA